MRTAESDDMLLVLMSKPTGLMYSYGEISSCSFSGVTITLLTCGPVLFRLDGFRHFFMYQIMKTMIAVMRSKKRIRPTTTPVTQLLLHPVMLHNSK